jgi:hypothetical protein
MALNQSGGAAAGHGASFDPQNHALATGKFQGTANFGNGSVTSSAGAGNADGYYAVYDEMKGLSAFIHYTGPTAAHYWNTESTLVSSGLAVVGGNFSGQVTFNGAVLTSGGSDLNALVTAFPAPRGTASWTFTSSGTGDEDFISGCRRRRQPHLRERPLHQDRNHRHQDL